MSEKEGNPEQSFNDAELQDIMNEIESLEKEFVEEGGVEASADTTPEATAEEAPEAQQEEQPEAQQEEAEVEEVETVVASEESSEEDSDDDLASEAESYEEDATPEPQAEVEVEVDNVVAMPTAQKPVATGGKGEGYMQFSGQGDMDMQLNFQLGSETATVNVSGGALNVTLAGVELQLTENGCEVNMEGGVKFSVPLTGSQAQGKKAA